MVLLDPVSQFQDHPKEGVTLRDVGELKIQGAPLGDRQLDVQGPRCQPQAHLLIVRRKELDLRITGRKYDQQVRLDEGSTLDLDFATPAQRKAFFRMIVELADWIKEHHSDEV